MTNIKYTLIYYIYNCRDMHVALDIRGLQVKPWIEWC